MSITSVYVVGDSISMHYGPYLKAMLASRLRYDRPRQAGESVEDLDKPVGENGGDSTNALSLVLARYGSQSATPVVPQSSELLVLNCGLHDIKISETTGQHQVSQDLYRRNLEEIIRFAHGAGQTVVWVRTTPVDDQRHDKMGRGLGFSRLNADVLQYNSIADSVMSEYNVPMIDLYTFTANLGPDVYCDHVHFTEEVRRLQAAYIVGSTCQILADNEREA